MGQKAMIAMSGGVDSAVTALLLHEAGYTCIGATMKLYNGGDVPLCRANTCCSLEDVEDARAIARRIGIPHYVFNFTGRFRESVIERFVRAYETGATPNPCIDCNRFLKFETLFHRARELHCDLLATGHYARIAYDEARGRYLLKKGVDAAKDQSYVLYAMTQEQLAHTRFPIGELEKTQVRELAASHGFINAEKRDSQDICFVPDGDYAAFIERYTGKTYPPGDFLDEDGHVIGQHRGIIRYTVGQRKGLGVALGAPVYVKAVDPTANTVTLAPDSALYSTTLIARDINLIALPAIDAPLRLKAKVRYRHTEQWASVRQTGDDELRIVFEAPQRAVTVGQSVVLYDGDTVVGGGTIAATQAE